MASTHEEQRLNSATFLRALGGAALAAFLACAFTPMPNIAARWLAESGPGSPADAIVVLGASVRPDGTLGDASLRRTIAGIQQYHRGLAPLVVFTGSRTGALSEAEQRRRLAQELGVPDTAIAIDDSALTTRDEARRVSVLLKAQSAHRILLVSDSLHLRRARGAFEQEGLEVALFPADSSDLDGAGPEARLQLSRLVAQQAAALVYYKLAS